MFCVTSDEPSILPCKGLVCVTGLSHFTHFFACSLDGDEAPNNQPLIMVIMVCIVALTRGELPPISPPYVRFSSSGLFLKSLES